MARWAATSAFADDVRFLCVCVESARVARSFHETFGFGEKVVNGYVPSGEYMPRGFGQLGCSGFVVSDARGNFVSRKTRAYLQVGEGAFRHVESILSELVPSATKKLPAPPASAAVSQPKQKRQKNNQTMIKPPASVGVDSMDDEHRECTDSFNRALKDPTDETLKHLHAILKEHFAHEEELIGRHSPRNGAFSKLASHALDHARILGIAAAELDRLAADKGAGDACGPEQGGRA